MQCSGHMMAHHCSHVLYKTCMPSFQHTYRGGSFGTAFEVALRCAVLIELNNAFQSPNTFIATKRPRDYKMSARQKYQIEININYS